MMRRAVLQAVMQRATAAHVAAGQKQAQAAALARTAEQAAADAAMLDEFLSSVHAYELASTATWSQSIRVLVLVDWSPSPS